MAEEYYVYKYKDGFVIMDVKLPLITEQPVFTGTEEECKKWVEESEEKDQMINETEQGIFDWGLDFLEMQKKSLKAMNKDFSVTNKYELEHISTQILLLNKFIDLIKNKTVLTPWENDPKSQQFTSTDDSSTIQATSSCNKTRSSS